MGDILKERKFMRYIVLGKTELKEELFNKDLTNTGINKRNNISR